MIAMKLAFVFPGQGSQFAGMGKALAERWPVARRVFEEADEALGFPLSELCFQGPEEQLKLTENTQPALLAVSVAAFEVLQEIGFLPSIVAGHSLGEYSALVAARGIGFTDALRLVRKRGQYMQQAVPAGTGAMAALLRMPAERLAAVLEQAAQGEVVSAANLNSPDQIVIAGHQGAVERAMELAKASGARRAVLLPVSAPFHCALMRPAQERMLTELKESPFHDLKIPLINNWKACKIQTADEAREGLYQQIPHPVLWIETVHRLASEGVSVAVEVGAGSVLCGLIRQIEPGMKTASFGGMDPAAGLEQLRLLIS
jgi:[acyl-carrier-protein] S-malonyltransferase